MEYSLSRNLQATASTSSATIHPDLLDTWERRAINHVTSLVNPLCLATPRHQDLQTSNRIRVFSLQQANLLHYVEPSKEIARRGTKDTDPPCVFGGIFHDQELVAGGQERPAAEAQTLWGAEPGWDHAACIGQPDCASCNTHPLVTPRQVESHSLDYITP